MFTVTICSQQFLAAIESALLRADVFPPRLETLVHGVIRDCHDYMNLSRSYLLYIRWERSCAGTYRSDFTDGDIMFRKIIHNS
jgi:hypothetical protein